ncbi:MAG TPA: molybdenum cofactor biosynthesis protein MoaE [Actinomycetes bacterium]|nr:molybdenum cofactor biosynthesis protein MoaE [Actinomycetes bacterium]
MSTVCLAEISYEPLDVAAVMAAVAAPSVGGTAVFVGAVRDHDDGQSVVELSYSAHPTAAATLREVADQVSERFPTSRLAVVHRVGDLAIGDLAVVVVAASDHRDQAFAAARALIDDVKSTVPIWKHQRFVDGSSTWVGLP